MATQAQSIDAREAHAKLEMDPDAMLVCAYADPKKFEQYHLEDAVPLNEFQKQADSISKQREIIFYCA